MKAYASNARRPSPERDRLIAEHIDIARRISLRLARRCPSWVSSEDLVSAGMLGLAEAAERYDDSRQEPFLVFAEKRDENFKDVPTSVELGDKVTLPQFRSVVVRAGTDPKQIKMLSDALEAAAKDPEYTAYLKEQYADPASFVPAKGAAAFLDHELKAMKALAADVGITPKK